MTIVVAILMVGVLIFFHELGHFLAARANGVAVLEFAIGMGPVVFSRQSGETLYSIRLIPMGGFARMAGEETEEIDLAVPDERRFDKKPLWRRVLVILAGPVTNLLLAALLFATLFLFAGIPSNAPVVGAVGEGWPAAAAGLQPGDRIISIDGKEVNSWQQIQLNVGEQPGKELTLLVDRGGETLTVLVTPSPHPETGQPLIGITPRIDRFNAIGAIKMGISETAWFTGEVVSLVAGMFRGQVEAEVAGPIGMIAMMGEVASTGWLNLLSFGAAISVQLCLFNLLPVPALDGGRLVFFLIEAIRGKPIDAEKEGFVHFLGFVALIAFMLIATFRDLQKLNVF